MYLLLRDCPFFGGSFIRGSTVTGLYEICTYEKTRYTLLNFIDQKNSSGVGKFVVVADPTVVEEVLRAEGKYPVRDKTITPQMKWLVAQSGYPPGFGME